MAVGGVDDDRDRAVVDQADAHMGAETPLAYCNAPGAQRLVEFDPHDVGMFRLARADEARPVPLAHVGEQRELRHGQDLTADVLDRPVHLALLVLEHAQTQNLMRQPCDLVIAVLIGHADQQQEPRTDLLKVERGIQIPQLIDNIDRRLRHTLQYHFHVSDSIAPTTTASELGIPRHIPPPKKNHKRERTRDYAASTEAGRHRRLRRTGNLSGNRGVSGPGGKNEATGDNIRKDGTDADNADGKSAQLDSTAQPDRSGPNGGPSGHWETRPVYETQRVQVPTGRAIFEHDWFTANVNDPAFEEHGDYLLKSGLPDNYRYEKVWQDKQIQVGTRQEDHGSYQVQSIKSGTKKVRTGTKRVQTGTKRVW
nr:MAG TPA: hypothetical protein [Caudoviricetes sp.]